MDFSQIIDEMKALDQTEEHRCYLEALQKFREETKEQNYDEIILPIIKRKELEKELEKLNEEKGRKLKELENMKKRCDESSDENSRFVKEIYGIKDIKKVEDECEELRKRINKVDDLTLKIQKEIMRIEAEKKRIKDEESCIEGSIESLFKKADVQEE